MSFNLPTNRRIQSPSQPISSTNIPAYQLDIQHACLGYHSMLQQRRRLHGCTTSRPRTPGRLLETYLCICMKTPDNADTCTICSKKRMYINNNGKLYNRICCLLPSPAAHCTLTLAKANIDNITPAPNTHSNH